MNRRIIFLFFCFSIALSQKKSPALYWESLEVGEKSAFINGVYATGAKLKYHHKQEINKQYNQNPGWVEPYFIERFYEIVDEHRSKKVGYDVGLISKALDAFYSNFDNMQIPLLEALRIVSLAQDGKTEKADLYLLKAQKKYKY
tara:strand:- start:583 stop:1014 length:432 start_codon:yes stop_codon:yes gene_type:complete